MVQDAIAAYRYNQASNIIARIVNFFEQWAEDRPGFNAFSPSVEAEQAERKLMESLNVLKVEAIRRNKPELTPE